MEQNSESPAEGLYRPRAGEYVEYYVNIINAQPDRELTLQQKQQFLDFENGLMDGELNSTAENRPAIEIRGIELPLNEVEDRTSYSQDRAELSLDYFLTDVGQQDLINIGVLEKPQLDKVELINKIRAKAIQVPRQSLKKLQEISEEYVDNATITAIAEGREAHTPERMVVFSDGTKLVERAKGLWAYKDFFKKVSRELNQNEDKGEDNLLTAKKSILRIYRKKVNSFLATLEPDLINFWRQIEEMDNSNQKTILHEAISLVWPMVERVNTEEESTSLKRFIIRLDRIRNGVSVDERVKYTAVSQDLEKLFEEEASTSEREIPPPIFSSEETSALDKIVFDAGQMQEFCKFLLGSLGKLSSEPDDTYDPDRPTRAEDGKWQVPIRTDTKAMGADDPPGALSIPSNFRRSLTKRTPPVGVIPGSLHEIKHVFQDDNYRNNQRGLKLGRLMKGKGFTVLREAGTLDIERQAQQRLFGRDRPDNPHHITAIKVLESGGSEIEAVKAFFNSYLKSNPTASRQTAASAAVRGVKRTARRKGGFDSQALNYAESTLIFKSAQKLDDRSRSIIFAEGSFSLDDLAELHRFGLLDNSTSEDFPLDRLLDLTEEYMRKIINESVDK